MAPKLKHHESGQVYYYGRRNLIRESVIMFTRPPQRGSAGERTCTRDYWQTELHNNLVMFFDPVFAMDCRILVHSNTRVDLETSVCLDGFF